MNSTTLTLSATIIGAVIGGLFTLAVVPLTHFLVHRTEGISTRITHSRQIALKGNWEGKAHQEVGMGLQNAFDYIFSIELTVNAHTITGQGKLYIETGRQFIGDLVIQGDFIHDRFFKVEYRFKNTPELIQFGFAILELTPMGHLDGRFLSFGAETKNLVWGDMQLSKVK